MTKNTIARKRAVRQPSIIEQQRKIYDNKKRRNFNITDIGKEIILLTEELGELARAFKNSNKKQAKEIDNRTEIIDAIVDIMVYCLGLCEMLGVDAEKELNLVVKKNNTRNHSGFMKKDNNT